MELELPEGATLERTRIVTERAIAYLEKNPYISIIMGAEDKSFLYQEMNRLLEAGETTKTE